VVKHFDSLTPALEQAPHRERVHVIGMVEHDRVADLLRAADVCVSIPTTDSSPRTVWEAMACGCPCVLSDLPWVDELIERGTEALVVPIEPEAVADACEHVLTDTAVAAGLAGRARALVERHRDQEAELGRLLSLYAELAAAGSRSVGG
jgi:glycosyltransferase involved in cell wall biosynthesis